MFKKFSRFLSFLLAIALVTTTFGSDLASVASYAVENADDLTERTQDEDDSIFEYMDDEEDSEEDSDTDGASYFDDEISEEDEDGASEDSEEPETADSEDSSNEATDETSGDITEEAADEASSAGSEEIAETPEERLVTVTYEAGKGGDVSKKSETIDINDKDAAFEGATATPWNEKYTFVNWTDENGKPVSSEAKFVPSDVTKDATFTANFVTAENMPSISVTDYDCGDMYVSVEAEEGLFPDGTKIDISPVDDDDALEIAQEVKENATAAKAVNIRFLYNEAEIQPADSKYVHVNMRLKEKIEGDEFSVLHQHGDEVNEIKNADVSVKTTGDVDAATGAEFDINKFSVFIIVVENDDENANNREVVNLNFYNKAKKNATEENKFFSKLVKKGDFVANVGIPKIPANSEFIGWYIDGVQKPDNKVEFTMPTDAADIEKYPMGRYEIGDVKTGVDINVYPVFSTTYYITFIGTDREIWKVDKITEADLDAKGNYSFKDKDHEITAGAGKGFKGWTKTKDSLTPDWNVDDTDWKINVEQETAAAGEDGIFLYAITAPAYWIRFEGNGSGSSFTGPQTLFRGEKLQKALDKAQAELLSEGYAQGKPTRNGYEFKGWSLEEGENKPEVSSTLKNTNIENITQAQANKELKLYAIWQAKQNASFTVNVWYQKVEGGTDYSKDYDFAYSQKINNVQANAEIKTSFSGNTISVKVGDGNNNTKWSTNNVTSTTPDGITNKSTNKTDVGFEYNETRGSKCEIRDGKGNTISKVSPSGDTVVNVYVQRREITVTLHVKDNTNGWTSYTGSSDTGDVYGYINGEYVYIYKFNGKWYRWDNDERYRGDRYRYTSSYDWTVYKTYKGLYGQSLKSKGYTWPSEYTWYPDKNKSEKPQTLLDRFDGEHDDYYGFSKGTVYHTIYHYKQNLDGSYNFAEPYVVTYDSSNNLNLYFQDKFTGYSVYKYITGKGTTPPNQNVDTAGSGWQVCGTYGNTSNDIYVVHNRKSYKLTERITYPDNTAEDASIDNILFEQVLSSVAGVQTIADKDYAPRKISGYAFGWYKDPAGTEVFDFDTKMPDGGIVVYGIYKPVKYKVILHPEGGTYVGQIRDAITAGKINVDANNVATIEVASTELVNRNNLITGITKTGYELIEWFDGNSRFDYSKRLTNDVHLYAHWRYQGLVKVIYQTDAAKGTFGGNKTEFSPEYNYGTDTSAVAAAPPTAKEGYSFIGWEVVGIDGERYLPNDAFRITTDVINANNEKETVEGIDYWIVRVNAVYTKTGGEGGEKEKTSVTFLANGGTLINGSNTTGFKAVNGGYKKENIYVNEKFTPLGQIYSKSGYVMTNWNTLPDDSGYSVPLSGVEIAADKINRTNPENPASNILYAIYKPIQVKVVMSGSDAGKKTYNGAEQSNKTYSVKEVICSINGKVVSNAGISVNVNEIAYSGDAAKGTNVGKYSKNLVANKFSYTGTSLNANNVSFDIDTANPAFKIEITKATLKVKTSSKEKQYDGTPLTSESATITGFVSANESATVKAKGSITEVGTTSNTYDAKDIVWGRGTNKDNYELTDELGTLEVKVRETVLTITAPSDSKTYDGTPLTCDGTSDDTSKKVKATGLPEGFSIVATASGSQTDAGTGINTVNSNYVIKDANNKEVSREFFKTITLQTGTLTVNKAKYTVQTGTAAKPYDGTALTQSEGAKINGLVNNETATVVPNGTITNPGTVDNTYTITWGTADENNYELAENGESLGTLTVSKAKITLRADSAEKYYDGKPLTSNKIHIGQNESLPEGYTIGGICEGTITDAGEASNVVKTWWIKDANNNDKTAFYEKKVEPIEGTLTVKAIPVTISTGEGSKPYDGLPLTNDSVTKTINVSDAVNDDTQAKVNKLVVTAVGSQTEVGSSDNEYEIDWNKSGEKSTNYAITDDLGTLEVTAYTSAVTITAASQSKTYDGNPLVNHTVTATGLPTGFTVSGTTTGSITNVEDNPAEGVKNNVVVTEGKDAYQILDQNGNAVDKTFFTNIEVVDGRLTINKAPLEITSADDEKEYDGQPLTNATVTKDGFVNGEGDKVQVSATGSITNVGETENTINIVWGDVKESNYDLTKTPGTLTVTAQTAEVKIIAPSDEKEYDGTALTCDGTSEDVNKQVKATGLPENFYVVGTATGSITNVGTAKNVVDADYVIKDADGNEVNKNFFSRKTLVDGELKITKATIEIHTEGASKEYDGTPLTKTDGFVVTGLKNNETVTVTPTGTITEVGTTANTYSIVWGTALESNYDVEEDLGTLEITAHNTPVVLTAASESKTYDGSALTNSTVTKSEALNDFTVTVTVSGSVTNVEDNKANNNIITEYHIFKGNVEKTDNFPNVTLVPGTLAINPAPAKVHTGSDEKQYDGLPLTKTDDTYIVATAADASDIVKAELASLVITTTGSVTEIADSPADNTYSIDNWGDVKESNYTIEDELGTLTITKNGKAVTVIAPSDSKTYDGTALTCDGTSEDEDKQVKATGLPEGFYVEGTASGTITDAGEAANVVNDGFVIRNAAGQDKTSSFENITKQNGKLTVNPVKIKITTQGDTKPYDGTALTKDAAEITPLSTVSSTVAAEIASIDVHAIGTITEIGSVDNDYEIKDDAWGNAKKGNYKIDEDSNSIGILEITGNNAEVVFTAASDNKTYDGKALVNSTVTVTGLPEGFSFEASASGSITNVEDNPAENEFNNTVDKGYKILLSGVDKTSSFTNVKTKGGRLVINPKKIKVTTGSDSKEYDGTPLTNSETSIGVFAEGESATVTATGTVTEITTKPVTNTYSIDWAANTKASNYEIEEELGTLEITGNTTNIVITAPSAEKVYDGSPLTDADVETPKYLKDLGYTVVAEVTGSVTHVSENADNNNVITSYSIMKDGVDHKGSFENITTEPGTLKIKTAPITIHTGSGKREYNGKALTNNDETRIIPANDASDAVKAELETVTVTAVGSITEVGKINNDYRDAAGTHIDWANVQSGDYAISDDLGTLEITAYSTEIVITAKSDEKYYDGAALTNSGVTFDPTQLPEGFKVKAVAEGSITDYDPDAKDNNIVKDNYQIVETINGADVDRRSNFSNIKLVPGTLKIKQVPVTVSSGSDSKEYDGKPLTKTDENKAEATIDEDKISETVQAQIDSMTLETLVSVTEVTPAPVENTVTIKNYGSLNPNNYDISYEPGTLEITSNTTAITITAASQEKTYDGTALTNHNVTAEGLPEGFTLSATAEGSITDVKDNPEQGVKNNIVVVEGENKYQILNEDGEDRTDSFTNRTVVDGVLSINPAPVTVHTGSDEKPYDGTALTKTDDTYIQATAEDASDIVKAQLKTVVINTTGSVTEYEDSPADNTYEITSWGDADKDNYFVTNELGQLVITKNNGKVKIIAPSDSKVYDGTALTADGSDPEKPITWEGLPEDFTVEAEATGSITNSGTVANTIKSGYAIKNADNKDVTALYTNLETVNGQLTVEPVQIKVTTGGTDKPYDATPLTLDEASITPLVTVNKAVQDEIDSIDIHAVGTITDVGTTPNVYEIKDDAWGKANKNNYEIVEEQNSIGTLEITANNAEIKITAATDEKTYDGDALENDSVSVTGAPKGVIVEAKAVGSITNKGTESNEVDTDSIAIYVRKDDGSKGKEVTGNFTNIKPVAGTLTINPVELKIGTGSGSWPYDGAVHQNTEATIASVDQVGEKVQAEIASITIVATGSVQEVGPEVDNPYEIRNWGNAKEDNYHIDEKNVELGTLEITGNNTLIEITAPSDEKIYDGTPLVNNKIETPEYLKNLGFTLVTTVVPTVEGGIINVADTAENNNHIESYQILDKNNVSKNESFTNVHIYDGTLTITPATVDISSNSAEKLYDGLPLTAGAIVEAFRGEDLVKKNVISAEHGNEAKEVTLVNDEKITVTLTRKLTKVDKIQNDYDIDWGTTISGNYKVTSDKGYLEVQDRGNDRFKVFASVDDVKETYNGSTWKDFDFKLEAEDATPSIVTEFVRKAAKFLANMLGITAGAQMNAETEHVVTPIKDGAQFKVTGVSVATQGIDAGNYQMTMDFSKAVVTDPEGNIVTDQFSFSEKEGSMGTLTIDPAVLNITTKGRTATYTGRVLTEPGMAVEGLIEGETIEYYTTGKQRRVGRSQNTYHIDYITAKQDNYTEKAELGWLVVNPAGGGDEPVDIPDEPVPGAPTPTGAVLGARREDGMPTDGAAVLGARRGKTDDETNTTARVFTLLVSAAAAVTLLVTGKKKKEEED